MRIGSNRGIKNRKFNGHTLTAEQEHSVDLMVDGGSLKIGAYAGATKTFTMAAGSHEMSGKGLYITFNKAIADEAKGILSSNVQSRTAHSLAYGRVGYRFKNRFQRVNGSVIVDHLKLKSGVHGFGAVTTGNMIIDMITRFTQSADTEIKTKHAPWSQLGQVADPQMQLYIAEQLVPLAKKTWGLMIDLEGTMPVTHDVYLKLWTLTRPSLPFDFIMFDEAQDANPMMLDLVTNQDCQQIYVGDKFQQIYSWRGAVNAMDVIETDDECSLTQSFRFGQDIADVANDILNNHLGANVNIRGFSEIDSRVGFAAPDVIISRTNGSMIGEIVTRESAGDTVHVSGGCAQAVSLIKGLTSLKNGKTTLQRDLALFTSWAEVEEYAETNSGNDIKAIIKQMNRYGDERLVNLLSNASRESEKNADIILTTGHKSKGLEWNNVQLANDFKSPDNEGYTAEETNVLYVASTRAKKVLDISGCAAALNAVNDNSPKSQSPGA